MKFFEVAILLVMSTHFFFYKREKASVSKDLCISSGSEFSSE